MEHIVVQGIGPDSAYLKLIQRFAEGPRNRIYELRTENGYRHGDMERFELSYRQYKRIESGETTNMTLANLFKIAKAFKLKPHELLDL